MFRRQGSQHRRALGTRGRGRDYGGMKVPYKGLNVGHGVRKSQLAWKILGRSAAVTDVHDHVMIQSANPKKTLVSPRS